MPYNIFGISFVYPQVIRLAVKISTYNVNGINGRLDVLLRWLKASKPDIVCLQESRCPPEKFPSQKFADAGYHGVWNCQKSWNGVAILSRKYEVKEVARHLPGDPTDVHSRYIEAEVNGLVIGCVYLPNGNPAPGLKFDYKLAWLKRLKKHSKKLLLKDKPTIITGDFNIVPTDMDAHKPERWVNDAVFFPEAKKGFKELLDQGWTDALRKLCPKEKIFTYWDYFRNAFNRDAGIRMDHFLLSPHFKRRLKGGGVDKDVRGWAKTSDHAPVWIEIADK